MYYVPVLAYNAPMLGNYRAILPFLAISAAVVLGIATLIHFESERDAREQQERNAEQRARLTRCRNYPKRVCTVVEIRQAGSWFGHNYEAVVHCDDGARYVEEYFGSLRAGDVADPQRESECRP